MRMHARFEDIVASAMKLPDHKRVRLAQELIASLDNEIEADVEELWLAGGALGWGLLSACA
jgi:type II secretory pathway component PulL